MIPTDLHDNGDKGGGTGGAGGTGGETTHTRVRWAGGGSGRGLGHAIDRNNINCSCTPCKPHTPRPSVDTNNVSDARSTTKLDTNTVGNST